MGAYLQKRELCLTALVPGQAEALAPALARAQAPVRPRARPGLDQVTALAPAIKHAHHIEADW